MIHYWFAVMIGRLPIEFRGRHRLASLFYPPNGWPRIKRLARLEGTHLWMHVDSTNHIGWNILVYGCYEKTLVRTMKHLLAGSRGKVALDIGANIGQYSLLLSEHFEQVVSVEPIPEFREQLVWNLQTNQISNVEVVPMALGAGQTEVEMALLIHDGQPQTASVHSGDYSFQDPFQWQFQRAKSVSLDHLIEMKRLSDLDYLKIDTDGSEQDILIGAEKTLRRFQPLIQIELMEDAKRWKPDLSVSGLAGTLRKLGYIFLDEHGRRYHSDTFNGNYFALPKRFYHLSRS